LLRLAGVEDNVDGFGRLFKSQLEKDMA
jgi:hypothetical protein